MMVSGGKKSPPSEIVAMCKAGGVHGQLNFGDSKADAAGWDSIQQGEIQGRERERGRFGIGGRCCQGGNDARSHGIWLMSPPENFSTSTVDG